ncbi:N-6 DNA methylase [Mesorhizobium sp. M1339]|uniref:N-6 DNA methylase n=1 Tax=Mesorhizobium sp. M1339 TaxID=2957086 RepID=UPI0033369A59
MRHFATESGKSKGQFYTPPNSRIMAQVIGIRSAKTSGDTTDPTCGSGSLLLKVADEAGSQCRALRAGETIIMPGGVSRSLIGVAANILP